MTQVTLQPACNIRWNANIEHCSVEFLVQSISPAPLKTVSFSIRSIKYLSVDHFRTVLRLNGSNPELRADIMSEHGFLKPNPVLFDLERLKPKAQLGHEVGLGGENYIAMIADIQMVFSLSPITLSSITKKIFICPAPCQRCNNKCSGFELHYWKKVCMNCRCGKIEHGVLDQTDHGKYFVGKIFDR